MPLGPMEYVVVEFKGNQPRAEVAAELRDIVSKGIIRIADMLMVKKDHEGNVTLLQSNDPGKDAIAWQPLTTGLSDLLSDGDVETLTNEVDPDSVAVLVLFEHVWAAKLRDAIGRASGRLVADGFVSPEAVDEAMQQKAAA